MKTILYNNKQAEISKSDFKEIVSHLGAGKVAILPTDTIYGFSAVINNLRGIKKIYKLKKRPLSQPAIILVSSLNMAKRYVKIPRNKLDLVKDIWRKSSPSSLIFLAQDNLKAPLVSQDNKICLRLPKHDLLIKIIRSLRQPLISTSLNISGKAYISDLDSLDSIYGLQLKDVLLLKSKQNKKRKASEIIDLSSSAIKKVR